MIVAVFDSGVDYTYEVFSVLPRMSVETAGGMTTEVITHFVRLAISDRLCPADLEQFELMAERAADAWPEADKLLPGVDFAGHHPMCSSAGDKLPSTNFFD